MLAIAQVANFSGCRSTVYAGSRGISKERSGAVHLRCQQNSPVIYVTNRQPAQVVCRCSDDCIFDLSPVKTALIHVNMCCHQLHFHLCSVALSPVKPFVLRVKVCCHLLSLYSRCAAADCVITRCSTSRSRQTNSSVISALLLRLVFCMSWVCFPSNLFLYGLSCAGAF